MDLQASTLPVAISGRLEASRGDHRRLAIALNGTIAAVTQSYQDHGKVVFSAIVPPDLLHSRSNSIAVLAVSGAGKRRILSPIHTGQQKTYDLAKRGGSAVIDTPSGAKIVVEARAVSGHVDRVEQAKGVNGALTVAGWALNGEKAPVDKVLLFENDRFLAAVTPSGKRPDIARTFGRTGFKSGFTLTTPSAGIFSHSLHVFGVAGDRA